MVDNPREGLLRARFRDRALFIPGEVWLCEPAHGSDLGLPDVWLIRKGGYYTPLELKRGENPLKLFRPSQRRFHRACLQGGAQTFCLSIVEEDLVLGYRLKLVGLNIEADLEKTIRIDELSFKYLSDWIDA